MQLERGWGTKFGLTVSGDISTINAEGRAERTQAPQARKRIELLSIVSYRRRIW